MTKKNSLSDVWSRFRIDESGCWMWTSRLDGSGYGKMKLDGKEWGAHRLIYEELIEPIPEGLELDHLCRNHACVNPAHLEPVTHIENCRRGVCGAVTTARQTAKTHCPYRHEYTPENTYTPNGHRNCRKCALQRSRNQRGG